MKTEFCYEVTRNYMANACYILHGLSRGLEGAGFTSEIITTLSRKYSQGSLKQGIQLKKRKLTEYVVGERM